MTPAEIYRCPACKGRLDEDAGGLRCPACSEGYPVENDIPDFLREDLSRSADPVLRRMRFIGRMARIYETRLWYPIVLNVYGGFRRTSLARLIEIVSGHVRSTRGRLLDVPCGPGTFGRRVASPSREVFGIDVSMGMLRQGAAYVARDRGEGTFDAALCCGSLHLFADTVAALREIARVMKPAAVLSVFTFTAGRGGILRFRRVRDWSRRRHGLHVFELPELERDLNAAGFEEFRPEIFGSTLAFTARKRAA